jgi:hypothetical protein
VDYLSSIAISCFRLDYLCSILSLAFLALVWIISVLFHFFHLDYLCFILFLSFGLFLSLTFLAFVWSEDGSGFSDEPTKGPHDSGAQKLMPKIK